MANNYLIALALFVSCGLIQPIVAGKRSRTSFEEAPAPCSYKPHEPEAWFYKAREDLDAAETLIAAELFPSALFHCHQAAEKILKSYLFFKKQPSPKIHDLVELTHLCIALNKGFKTFLPAIHTLNPLGRKYNYPSLLMNLPSEEDATQALETARNLEQYVLRKYCLESR